MNLPWSEGLVQRTLPHLPERSWRPSLPCIMGLPAIRRAEPIMPIVITQRDSALSMTWRLPLRFCLNGIGSGGF